MKKITSRDIKAFLVGVLVMVLIDLVFDWPDFVEGYNQGFQLFK